MGSLNFLSSNAEELGEDISHVVDVVREGGISGLIEKLSQKFKDILPTIMIAAIFTVVALILAFVAIRLIKRWLVKLKIEPALHYFITAVVRYLLLGLIVVSALGILGIPLTPIITALGAVGLALSLALKDSLSNVAGGVFLLFNCPFRTGDYIELKGVAGTVKEIRLTYTILETSFNRCIFIPNSDFSKATITNYSTAPVRCLELTFSVSPVKGNIDAAKAIISEALESSGMLLPEPKPSVRVSGQTDSAIQITSLAWVEPSKLYDLKAYVIQRARERLKESEIS